MRADVIIDISEQMETIAKMLACHRSQLFEWLAYHDEILETVPADEQQKLKWVQSWIERHVQPRAQRFRRELNSHLGEAKGKATEFIEVFEISEYARQPDRELIGHLFPNSMVQ